MSLLTVAEAAERMAISPKQVRRLISDGELPTVRLGKSARSDRIDPADLGECIQRCRSTREVVSGTPTARLAVNALSKVLDKALRKQKQKPSKRRSEPALKIVAGTSTT